MTATDLALDLEIDPSRVRELGPGERKLLAGMDPDMSMTIIGGDLYIYADVYGTVFVNTEFKGGGWGFAITGYDFDTIPLGIWALNWLRGEIKKENGE